MNTPEYSFLKKAGRILNSGQSRSLILSGNIHDLFHVQMQKSSRYVPLVPFLGMKWDVNHHIVIIYELNGPIRFLGEKDREKLGHAWLRWRTGLDSDSLTIETMLSHGKIRSELETMSKAFETNLMDSVGKPTVALELLRQLCLCSRTRINDQPLLFEDLIVLIEGADMVIPEGEITRLSDADRHRVSICHDWFSDPGFMEGKDSVVLLAESSSLVHHRIARLPQVMDIPIPAPDPTQRLHFIQWFMESQQSSTETRLWGSQEELAFLTAGLSIQSLNQLLKGAAHEGRTIQSKDVVEKVEDFIQSQLGEDIVEFTKPEHSLDDVVGFSKLKNFLREELIPRFRMSGSQTLPGAAVCGPIGGGKTFIFEAVAHELDMVVLVLKNVRSQWFGQTDVIFERLRRTLDALAKVVIFVDEADTQFGGVGADAHATERRLTGKIQAMMSDPRLKGRVYWLLMTARIHLLSPDIRRPGRVGDLIIPVLDPEGEDKQAFLRWTLEPSLGRELSEQELASFGHTLGPYSAASFASLRSELKAKASIKGDSLTLEEIQSVTSDHLVPAISRTRRYQTLQALINCTRRSLLPNPSIGEEERQSWESELRALERQGIG